MSMSWIDTSLKIGRSIIFGLLSTSVAFGAQTQTKPAFPDWVQKSNENAQILIDVLARFNPEIASQVGAEGVDDQVIDLKPEVNERTKAAIRDAVKKLQAKLASEQNPDIRTDLQILIKASNDGIKGTELNERYSLPYFNMSQTMFQGIRALLDDQVSPDRRKEAIVRLNRYSGNETGYSPVTNLAMDRTREQFGKKELVGPAKLQVERDLKTSQFFIQGIGQLFEKYSLDGYKDSYEKLKTQVAAYDDFVRKEILPRSREDFRLPPPLYEFSLDQSGIDVAPLTLAKEGREAFASIQKEMQQLAQVVAKEKGFQQTDYRDVIRELKKKQLVGEAILPHYQKRIKEIEDIIRTKHLVTLPQREMRIRLASEAESANIPAPNMRPPRLIGNTGEMGEFVLPLSIPAAPGSPEATQKFDDFTFEAASWTLTAHEGRPGHEMQFASMIEKGVSIARGIFALNSVNVEGWGLYSEAILQPYEPAEGQLITLQNRLMRAARAFLDPELQFGKITREQAKQILLNDVVLSDAMATQEVDRYTFLAPGQAPSYFYGYTELMKLRKDVESAQGSAFNQQEYHDFILHQGLLPIHMLEGMVRKEFIKKAA
jgi:hypothetical protein